MNLIFNRIVVSSIFASLALTSCVTKAPSASGIGGISSGAIARGIGLSSTEAAIIGTAVGVTTAVIVYSYEKRKATEREQALARQRVAKFKSKMSAKSKSKPKTRYVAVPVEKADTVMLYDTQKEKMLGNSAYEFDKTPKKGEVVKFGSVNAEYVGI
ncbi:MAG: hypothetical protein QM496_06445 [Verrucomicrobiota bacterium]